MYTTQAELLQRFGDRELIELTDRAHSGAIDGAVLERAIADADALVNSYLTPRYRLPLAPALIEQSSLGAVASDLARYHLYDGAATEEVEKRYERAVAWLKDLARGQASLGGDDRAVATPEGRAVVRSPDSGIDWSLYS